MRAGRALAALLLLATLPSAPAAAEGFAARLAFADPQRAEVLPVLGGSLALGSAASGAPTVMHEVRPFTVRGLAVACWEYPCHQAEGELVVQVAAGSTVALRFPRTGQLALQADGALAAPVELDARKAGFGELSAGMTLVPSLAVVAPGGLLSFLPETLPPSPGGPVPAPAPAPGLPGPVASMFQAPDPDDGRGAVLAGLSEDSRIEVVDAGRVVHAIQGHGALILQGAIVADDVAAEAYLLPCPARCDLEVRHGGLGVDVVGSVRRLLGLVALADGAAAPAIDLGPWGDVVDPVADGAFLEVPLAAGPSGFDVGNLTLVRFERLAATLHPGAGPAEGSGDLVIQSGQVRGSPDFVGGRYFGMPPWSWVIWAAALVALALRWATRAPRESERWDRLQWLGRVLGALAWAALAVVWHLGFGRVLGVSATSRGLDASARLLVGAVEAATLLAMAAMVVVPARLLLSSLARLLRQGRLMGLAGPAASLAGILLGPPLLLGLVDLALGLFR